MRVTISDIARIANVTPSTVSRVISKNPHISTETCERVRRVMREMDYHPNIIARSLVRRTTNIVGVLLPTTGDRAFHHVFFSELLRGIMAQANAKGYDILLSVGENPESEDISIRNFIGGGVTEGIILTVSRMDQRYLHFSVGSHFPIVMIGRPEKQWEDQISWVDSDNVDAGYRLTRYFIEKGRRHIAFIGLADGVMVTADRYVGYRRALTEAGLSVDPAIVVHSKFMENDADGVVEALFSSGSPIDGIIAADDSQAFAAIRQLAKRGYSVPKDVSVAGFNNVPLSENYNPPLTSVDIEADMLGCRAFDLLYGQINRKSNMPSHIIVPTRLISRVSA